MQIETKTTDLTKLPLHSAIALMGGFNELSAQDLAFGVASGKITIANVQSSALVYASINKIHHYYVAEFVQSVKSYAKQFSLPKC